jgi:adenylate cyclase
MPADASDGDLIDRVVLNLERGALLADGVECALRPKSFALLNHFADNPGRLIDRDEIMRAVWPGVFVSDDSIAQCIKDIRRALGDGEKRLLRTVPRRGYLFAPGLRRAVSASPSGAPADIAETARPALHSPAPRSSADKPSIAVLPFQNMSGDPGQDYFVDGMVEEIITALSRIRWLRVVPRVSSFTYKGQTLDIRRVGPELGVNYVLEGSVRKAGDSLRITCRLIDTGTVAHLWIDRFDGSLRDVFDFQDRVASSVAGVIEPALQAAEAARAVSRPTADVTAYDLYLRGYAMFMASSGRFPDAVRLMEQAIARDPGYGQALGWAAVGLTRLIGDGRSEDPARDRARAIDFATRALAAAEDDPNIIVNAANVLVWFGEDMGAMLALVDRAMAINPNFARGWHISGLLRLRAGDLDAAIAHTEISLRLSPRAGDGGSTRLNIGAAHFFARRFDQALPTLLLASQDDPTDPHPFRYLAACYAHMGRLDDAGAISARLRVIGDAVVPDLNYLRDPAHREFYQSGLRLAAGAALEPTAARDPADDAR